MRRRSGTCVAVVVALLVASCDDEILTDVDLPKDAAAADRAADAPKEGAAGDAASSDGSSATDSGPDEKTDDGATAEGGD